MQKETFQGGAGSRLYRPRYAIPRRALNTSIHTGGDAPFQSAPIDMPPPRQLRTWGFTAVMLSMDSLNTLRRHLAPASNVFMVKVIAKARLPRYCARGKIAANEQSTSLLYTIRFSWPQLTQLIVAPTWA